MKKIIRSPRNLAYFGCEMEPELLARFQALCVVTDRGSRELTTEIILNHIQRWESKLDRNSRIAYNIILKTKTVEPKFEIPHEV